MSWVSGLQPALPEIDLLAHAQPVFQPALHIILSNSVPAQLLKRLPLCKLLTSDRFEGSAVRDHTAKENSMKLALLSDIHANLQAVQACLAHAEQHGANQFALLGDLVGYGGDPAPVMDRIMQLAQAGAVVLKGNHDAMALNPPQQSGALGAATAAWTHAQLNPEHQQFLAALPLTARLQSCFLVHASADAPGEWRYVDDERSASASLAAAAADPAVRYVFGGHVHHQTLYYKGSRGKLMAFSPTAGVPIPLPTHRHWIATVGSVGQPRDGLPSAMYALFDLKQARLTFHRVPYDHMAAAAAVRRAGLPEYFAKRLEEGR